MTVSTAVFSNIYQSKILSYYNYKTYKPLKRTIIIIIIIIIMKSYTKYKKQMSNNQHTEMGLSS